MTALTPAARSLRIPWRKRGDLQCVPLQFEGRPAWGIKDPVTLAYFELHEESYFVLQQLDGQVTHEDVLPFLSRTLSPAHTVRGGAAAISGTTHFAGLGRRGISRSREMLVAKEAALRSQNRWRRWTSLLAIRFRGFDPDRLLGVMLKGFGGLFSPWAIAAGIVLIVSAVGLVAVQFDELIARMPDAQALLTVPNLIWLSLLLAVVKVLHEFGHGLTCKRFGGECHELGVMLLVFTPTLYCNVSDIWMVPDKWRRIAVSARECGSRPSSPPPAHGCGGSVSRGCFIHSV